MVVGRACNGFEKLPKEMPEREDRERVARELARWPMCWVVNQWGRGEGNRTSRSAFWRVIRRVSLQIVEGATEGDWPTHLVWSNLYKVSPSAGGNPGATLRNAQRGGCRELLELELRTFRPKRVLFLTGWNWAEELLCTPREPQEPADTFVDRVWDQSLDPESGLAISRFVVAQHPQGKNEDDWVCDVLQQFRGP